MKNDNKIEYGVKSNIVSFGGNPMQVIIKQSEYPVKFTKDPEIK